MISVMVWAQLVRCGIPGALLAQGSYAKGGRVSG